MTLQARMLADMGEFAEALELAAAIPASQVRLSPQCSAVPLSSAAQMMSVT